MEWQGWLTLAVVVAALAAMVREVASPDFVMLAALLGLAAVGVLTPIEAFSGFSNPALWTVCALFVVSAALRQTGALDLTLGRLLRPARDAMSGTLRICVPVAGLSAFLNNAPIVAMMTPAVIDWAQRTGMAASRFLIPLSYAAILGSSTTVIGTSVNLTTAGLLISAGMPELGFFELAPLGLPICAAGFLYLVAIAPRLLPDRRNPSDTLGDERREYTAAMLVRSDCPLVGQSVEEAGLRHLPGLYLIEIDRGGRILTPVAPDEVIRASDLLVFAGVVSTIVDLHRIRGLVPSEQESLTPGAKRLAEAVISASSPLVEKSIRDSNFRTVYDAAVIAVHRNGERVPGKIGEIVLRPGDTLLLQTAPGFLRAHRNSPDFYLVSELQGERIPDHDRAWISIAILIAMVISVAGGLLPISVASFLAAGALLGMRCIEGAQARASIVWRILFVIGAGLGLAVAMEKTGAASAAAHLLVATAASLGPIGVLAVLYGVSVLMAETLHHNAAVAIMFPIAVAAAGEIGVDPRGFIMGITVASCCSFASPVAYQTHLIIYGPGGYRFADFVRVGLPLDLICGVVAVSLIPFLWPF